MERKAQGADAMTPQLQGDRQGKLYRKPSYNEISDEIRTEALTTSIKNTRAILKKAYKRGRVNLFDVDEVEAQAQEYLQACEAAAVFPTFLSFSASLGVSRARLYKFMDENPNSPSTQYLDQLRSAFAAIIAQASLTKQSDPATSIFLLKNSAQGMSDKLQLEAVQSSDPLGEKKTADEIMAKYSDLIEDEYDEYDN